MNKLRSEIRWRRTLWRWERRRWSQKIIMAIVWRLPKPIVYWSAIRLAAHATTGRYGNTEVPRLPMMEAIKRWE